MFWVVLSAIPPSELGPLNPASYFIFPIHLYGFNLGVLGNFHGIGHPAFLNTGPSTGALNIFGSWSKMDEKRQKYDFWPILGYF